MPNICSNRFVGKRKLLDPFIKDGEFSFNNFIPLPPLLRRVRAGSTPAWDPRPDDPKSETLALTDEDRKMLLDKYGSLDWYDWSCKNWGTKWDVMDEYSLSLILDSDPEEVVVFDFDTAWSPPEPLMIALSKLFPEEEFSLEACDEGGAFNVLITYKNGTWDEQEIEPLPEEGGDE